MQTNLSERKQINRDSGLTHSKRASLQLWAEVFFSKLPKLPRSCSINQWSTKSSNYALWFVLTRWTTPIVMQCSKVRDLIQFENDKSVNWPVWPHHALVRRQTRNSIEYKKPLDSSKVNNASWLFHRMIPVLYCYCQCMTIMAVCSIYIALSYIQMLERWTCACQWDWLACFDHMRRGKTENASEALLLCHGYCPKLWHYYKKDKRVKYNFKKIKIKWKWKWKIKIKIKIK